MADTGRSRSSKRGTAIERLAALRESDTASRETDSDPVDTATVPVPPSTDPVTPDAARDGTIGSHPIDTDTAPHEENTVSTTPESAPAADEFIDVELPAGTGKFNPYEAPLKASYESGKAKGKILPDAEVDDAKRAIRKASTKLNIGATIRVQNKGDGTSLVAFLGTERATRSK